MGLKTFNEPLLASYESVSDKTQKRGKEKRKKERPEIYITLILLIPLVSKNLDDKTIGNKCFPPQHLIIKQMKKSRTANITSTAEVVLRL